MKWKYAMTHWRWSGCQIRTINFTWNNKKHFQFKCHQQKFYIEYIIQHDTRATFHVRVQQQLTIAQERFAT